MSIELRPATAADHELIARALYAAWQWRHPWDEEGFAEHRRAGDPDNYLDDFGARPGDCGVIAEAVSGQDRKFAGAAWYRFFTDVDHRAGYAAFDVPELVIAVEPGFRGVGVGRRLMTELIGLASSRGIRAVSLHVSDENAIASAMYRSLGFRPDHDHDGRGTVMIKELSPKS